MMSVTTIRQWGMQLLSKFVAVLVTLLLCGVITLLQNPSRAHAHTAVYAATAPAASVNVEHAGSVQLQPGLFHQLAPFADLGFDQRAEGVRRAPHRG